MAYSEGFVFVAFGVIVVLIAFTMIARRQRFGRRFEPRAVPRTWAKIKYVIMSEDEEPVSA